ncbi:ATP-binding cassette subfamily A, member 1 [Novymonas esmeraldas]|uniref:ATP-binding cassette subfamily A, member 1 n=1 Tax=Novymonas esmeraldas TaxID=1808958 RepID=A0AAW0EZS3_9TRYP
MTTPLPLEMTSLSEDATPPLELAAAVKSPHSKDSDALEKSSTTARDGCSPPPPLVEPDTAVSGASLQKQGYTGNALEMETAGGSSYPSSSYGPGSSYDYAKSHTSVQGSERSAKRHPRNSSRPGTRASTVSPLPRTQRKIGRPDQLFAILSRSAFQQLRRPAGLVLEIVIPLIFVGITVVLWGIWGGVTFPETSFVPPQRATLGQLTVPEASGICVNQTAYAAPIGSLPPCSIVAYPYTCDGDMTATPFPARSICRNNSISFAGLTVAYLGSFVGNLTRVPSLNTIITFQMLAQMQIGPINKLGSTAVSRLYPIMAVNAIVSSGNVYFVGEESFTTALIAHMSSISGLFHFFTDGKVYPSTSAARSAAPAKSMIWAIVELRSSDADGLDLVLHMNNSALPSFGVIDDAAYPGGALTETAEVYLASGFLTLQQTVTEFYLAHYGLFNLPQTQMVASFAYPKYTRTPLLLSSRDILPLVFGVAFLYSVSQQTKRIVLEKELRIREAMLIMGLQQWTLYVSEFIVQVAIFVPTCILCVIMLKLTFVTKSDALILFLVFLLFAVTTIPLSGLIAALFSKSRLASLVTPVIYFILVIPTFAMTNASGGVVTGFSVFSPSGFAAALNVFLLHESGSGFGAVQFTWKRDSPTLAVLLGMLAADFFIYYLLMLYLDAVLPKDWGTPKHPLFFVLEPLRWGLGGGPKRLEGGEDGRAEDGVFEDAEHGGDVVVFDGLRKVYSRGGKKFVAVNNLYWGMREGEISVLLGHNGAGKTTLLSMMTGMVEPDEGDCYIYGNSVRTATTAVRQELGYCPQHNILWPELTCRDHLEFFGRIKGLKGWELEDAMCRMLYETDLLDKMDQPAKSLSGGMKRKLSIAIAFVGGSRLVFLDEPTAGLDVAARRYIWELLQRMSRMHTILLTTHYMDEADLLGRRIGIMSQGRLKCTGSSMFLKSRLGVGYHIVISVDPDLDQKAIDAFVLSSVTGASIQGHNGTELSYQLPASSVDEFPQFLNEIDSVEADGIRGYSLAATTLEEVFLKVSEEDLHQGGEVVSKEQMRRIWHCDISSSVAGTQFKAMLAKRLWCALRDRRMQCFQIVCPVVCILIAMLLNLINFGLAKSLVLDYSMFTGHAESVVLAAGCEALWGETPPLRGAIVNETNFLTGEMLSEYALDTWYVHAAPRFGGAACADPTLAANSTTAVNNIFFVNTSSHHQAALNLAAHYDLLARRGSSSSSSSSGSVGSVGSVGSGGTAYVKHTAAVMDKPDSSNAMTFIFIGALILIPMSFLPSNPVAWVVKERECGSRHLQKLCGLNFFVYWAANFVFDMAAYVISMCLCITIFAIFNRREFIETDRVGGTFTLFLLYGLTSTVGAYALSFAFKEHASAQMVVMAVCLVLGFLFNIVVFVLQLRDDTANVSKKLRFIFRLMPSYVIGEGIVDLLMLKSNITLGQAKSVWDMNQLGWPLVYLAVEFPVFSVITLLLDHPALGQLFQRRRYRRHTEPVRAADEDPDVTEERAGVQSAENNGESTDVVRVVNLQKNYGGGKLAVKGITFSIFPGEVFGFLGTNGAGKTTTISMLCQQFLPTGGSAYVCGYDIVTESREALQCIGYCPQFDATLDLLTVEEQLQLYARIRGIVSSAWPALIDALCTLCELTMYRKTVTSALSGGNRRKLSVAMSLVGGPQVVFLDEPSAGMDPVARRGMWTTIQRAAKHCSVVLTTHHLEEVEALADMVAIMVKGHIRCIGDKVHLKNKFGSAFEVSIRIEAAQYAGRLVDFMKAEFPDAHANEADGCRFVYQLPRDRSFGDIFSSFQANKAQLHITDYSLSQTSIEQVFMRISEASKHL